MQLTLHNEKRQPFGCLFFASILAFLLLRLMQQFFDRDKAVCRSLGEALKAHRTEKQMTQEFVAETLGVSRQAVSKWENGTLAERFQKNPEQLYTGVLNTLFSEPDEGK